MGSANYRSFLKPLATMIVNAARVADVARVADAAIIGDALERIRKGDRGDGAANRLP